MEGDQTELRNIERLLHALDEEINEPHRAIDEPFLMTIGKVHTIRGRGATVSGRVHRGMARVGDDVQILGINERRTTCIIEMETFNKRLDQGQAGDNIACMLRGVDFEDVKRGQVLACPGSTVPHVKFQAEIQVCSTGQGGRHTPFFNNYRPQIYLKTASVPGRVTLMEHVAMVMPGDFQTVTIELDKPVWMESGMLFSAREGSKTVFTGVVRDILA